jgi:hypothetical protein
MSAIKNIDNQVKVIFLGQCLQYGYRHVESASTYPRLAMKMLKARFPGVNFKYDLKYLYHPRGLKAILKRRLLLTRPDIVVIGLPAMFAATHWRVNMIYEIAPEIVDTARAFMQKIDARRGHEAAGPAEALLNKTFAVHAPLALNEYERLVEEAILSSRSSSDCRFVLMGPGRFNEDTNEDYPIHSPELWASVNQMILGLGKRLGVPVINSHEALEDYGSEVYNPNNHRWSPYGHEVMAREVETVLTSQIKALRLEQIS